MAALAASTCKRHCRPGAGPARSPLRPTADRTCAPAATQTTTTAQATIAQHEQWYAGAWKGPAEHSPNPVVAAPIELVRADAGATPRHTSGVVVGASATAVLGQAAGAVGGDEPLPRAVEFPSYDHVRSACLSLARQVSGLTPRPAPPSASPLRHLDRPAHPQHTPTGLPVTDCLVRAAVALPCGRSEVHGAAGLWVAQFGGGAAAAAVPASTQLQLHSADAAALVAHIASHAALTVAASCAHAGAYSLRVRCTPPAQGALDATDSGGTRGACLTYCPPSALVMSEETQRLLRGVRKDAAADVLTADNLDTALEDLSGSLTASLLVLLAATQPLPLLRQQQQQQPAAATPAVLLPPPPPAQSAAAAGAAAAPDNGAAGTQMPLESVAAALEPELLTHPWLFCLLLHRYLDLAPSQTTALDTLRVLWAVLLLPLAVGPEAGASAAVDTAAAGQQGEGEDADPSPLADVGRLLPDLASLLARQVRDRLRLAATLQHCDPLELDGTWQLGMQAMAVLRASIRGSREGGASQSPPQQDPTATAAAGSSSTYGRDDGDEGEELGWTMRAFLDSFDHDSFDFLEQHQDLDEGNPSEDTHTGALLMAVLQTLLKKLHDHLAPAAAPPSASARSTAAGSGGGGGGGDGAAATGPDGSSAAGVAGMAPAAPVVLFLEPPPEPQRLMFTPRSEAGWVAFLDGSAQRQAALVAVWPELQHLLFNGDSPGPSNSGSGGGKPARRRRGLRYKSNGSAGGAGGRATSDALPSTSLGCPQRRKFHASNVTAAFRALKAQAPDALLLPLAGSGRGAAEEAAETSNGGGGGSGHNAAAAPPSASASLSMPYTESVQMAFTDTRGRRVGLMLAEHGASRRTPGELVMMQAALHGEVYRRAAAPSSPAAGSASASASGISTAAPSGPAIDLVVIVEMEREWWHLKSGYLQAASKARGRGGLSEAEASDIDFSFGFSALGWEHQLGLLSWALGQAGVELPLGLRL